MGIVRAETIARMRKAFREGVSASRFIADMKAIGLSYRRTDMFADYRSIAQLERKEGAGRFVRKDYYPTEKSMATVEWKMSKEYMYKVKSQRRLYPDAPITERFVNITSDVPMTRAMVEQEAWERSFSQSPLLPGEERVFIMWTPIHRAEM